MSDFVFGGVVAGMLFIPALSATVFAIRRARGRKQRGRRW